MTYRGRIKDPTTVVLDQPIPLPEGTEVQVNSVPATEKLPTLAERFRDVAGKAVGLPSDLAENHDHYLHGLPKRKP